MSKDVVMEIEEAAKDLLSEATLKLVYAKMEKEGFDRYGKEAVSLWREVVETMEGRAEGLLVKGEHAANVWLRFLFPFGHVSDVFVRRITSLIGIKIGIKIIEEGVEGVSESKSTLMTVVVLDRMAENLAEELGVEPPVRLYDLEETARLVAVGSILGFFGERLEQVEGGV